MVENLLLSFLALGCGPFLVALARRRAWTTIGVDSFCVVTISGFSLLHLLPECVERAGWSVLPLALAGFLAPTLAERGLRRDSRQLRWFVLLLALLGMAAHDTLDGLFLHGSALPPGARDDREVTAWAVILHRIPEGIAIWWIVPRTLGTLAAGSVMAVTVAATAFGYFVGPGLLASGSTTGLTMLQALLAGSLLHVVFHAHIPAPRDRQRWHIASVAGAVIGATALGFVIKDHFPAGEHGAPGAIFLRLATESAPALVFAYLLVGLCQAFLPAGWVRSLTRGSALGQAVRGVAIGLPLPVCSCGVVPIYRELVQQGASLAAALAFLVATPELEIAAALLTFKLMGGEVALVRIAMAALLALFVGMFVGGLAPRRPVPPGAGALPEPATGNLGQRLLAALRFGYGPAVDNTASWILMGLLLSAVLMPYVDRDWIAALPSGIDVPVAALLGLPLYVCATGSTPLGAMLLAQGLSPGAVLALLLTGPATNVTTFGMLGRLHGKRVAALFAASMWLGAIALGYLANWILPPAPRLAPSLAATAHEHGAADWSFLAVLAALFAASLLRQGVRPFLERLFESPANLDGMAASCCASVDTGAAAEPCADGHAHGGHHHGHVHAHGHHHPDARP